jgi:phospholipid/cholesterol/gamma-HCH transport system substrate-binding protein
MPRRRHWSDLRTGLIAAAAILATAVAILVYARVGSLHGKTFWLYVVTEEARGVIRGTDVWLDGQRVGRVENIGFIPPTRTDVRGVVMQLKVLESARTHVRLDSRADVRSGGSLISSPVLSLRSGTMAARPVVSGDTLRARAQTDFENAASRLAVASRGLPEILANVKTLSTSMKTTEGTVGAFAIEGMDQARVVMMRSGRLMTSLTSPRHGSLAAFMGGTRPLADQLLVTLARTDSIRTLLAGGAGRLGRFRRDSTLLGAIASTRAELDTLRARAAGTTGSVGRFRNDSAVFDAIADARRQLDSLFIDLRKRPLRYIAF